MATITEELSNPKNRPWIIGAGALTAGVVGYAWWTRGRQEALASERAIAQVPGAVEEPTDEPGFDIIGGTSGTIPANNSEWTQLARRLLIENGWEGVAVDTALGKFLGRQPLTSSEEQIARAATALAGQPPEGGPWPIIPTAPTPAAVPLAAPILTRTNPVYRNGAWEYVISWQPVTGATKYWFEHVGGSSGFITATQSTVIRAGANRTDTWRFAAVNAAGTKGPVSTISTSMGAAPAGAGQTKPTPPKSVSARAIGGGRASIVWSGATGGPGSYYEIRSRGIVGTWKRVNGTSYTTVARWRPGTKLSFEVRTRNALGTSAGKISNTIVIR